MKSAYEKIKKFNEKLQVTTHITSLPKFSGGRPLRLGDMYHEVCEYLRNLLIAGHIVNFRIVVAALIFDSCLKNFVISN